MLEGAPAEIALSTYNAAKTRAESARAARDRVLTEKNKQVWEANYSVYWARKVWVELNGKASRSPGAGDRKAF